MTARRASLLAPLVAVALLAAATPATPSSTSAAGPDIGELEAASTSSPTVRRVVQPVGVPGRWRLVFRDEFDGTRLDLDKWRPNWLAGSDRAVTKPVNDAELSAYAPARCASPTGPCGCAS
ncbi:hypothetical protein [Nocardioides sp. TF02-7]|uniref:hypothetical protein n=1 Tax=Nocardioides sp. TF02-7 TaxID=2917724 RepID=UPI001F06055C|nr:hypothetical protein [Nocardioides sp. TF02-7]UMG92279.1 hypothetical protein MF408_20600 [Nocardioides sp. TF02-7]